MNNGQLTAKQKMFCEEYLVDLNASQAAIRAGYSQRSSASIGEENLKKPEIVRRIRLLQGLRNMRTRIRADKVLEELEKIAFTQEGVKTSDRLKALGMLAKHTGLFEKQTDRSPDFIQEYDESKAPPKDTYIIDWPFINALSHTTRLLLMKSILKGMREIKYGKPETTAGTGLDQGNNGDYEQGYIDLIDLMREQLTEKRFRKVLKKAGLRPNNHVSRGSPVRIKESA